MKNQLKCVVVGAILATSLFCTTGVFADTQVFVNSQRISNTINKDGRVYVQLRDLSHYTGYEVEYNETNDTVNFYKGDGTGEKPIVKRETSIFPTTVNEISDGDRQEIIKIYELSKSENPKEISREDFEQNGYSYHLMDITKNDTSSIDYREYAEPITIDTGSNNVNTILEQLPKEKEVTTEEGYAGVLQLDISSIKSEVKGYKSSSYTATETREYPNLSSMDTSLVPKTISANGKTYTLSDVQWKSMNNTAVDFTELPDTYKAVVKYTTTGTKSTLTGYTTTAEYKGTVSKNLEGKTVYTAYFLGKPLVIETPEPKELTVAELEQQLKEAKAKEKAQQEAEKAANGSNMDFNIMWVLIPLFGFGACGGIAYLLFFRKNVTVANLQDDKYKVIGKVRVTKKNPVIDLTDFTKQVTNPTFLLTLDYITAKFMKDRRITINYGANSTHQDVKYEKLDKSGYQMQEIEF